jgi:hypothetical protein
VKKMGRPSLEDTDPKLAQRVREALLAGESHEEIRKRLKVPSSAVERLRPIAFAEQRAKALVTLEPLVLAAIRGGLSRRTVASIIYRATGLEIEMKGERDG